MIIFTLRVSLSFLELLKCLMGNDFSNSEEEEEFPEHFLLVKPCLINLLGGEKSGTAWGCFLSVCTWYVVKHVRGGAGSSSACQPWESKQGKHSWAISHEYSGCDSNYVHNIKRFPLSGFKNVTAVKFCMMVWSIKILFVVSVHLPTNVHF